MAYVRGQLGHHSIQVTIDTYGHLVPGGNRAAVDRLDDFDETKAESAKEDNADRNHPQPKEVTVFDEIDRPARSL